MSLRIGIDFDNTLADYHGVFAAVGREEGLLPEDFRGGKGEVKAFLEERDWMRLQGRVYGAHMGKARFFPGALDFLHKARGLGAEVRVVSHKTVHGHFDPDRVDLRRAAVAWMDRSGVFAADGAALARDHVLFEATREEKVARIADLNLTHFVDDLEPVLRHARFPTGVVRILFGAERCAAGLVACPDWAAVAREVFGAA